MLFVDVLSTEGRFGVGVALISSDRCQFFEALRFEFKTSNNEALYEALIVGIKMGKKLEFPRLIGHSDSQLLVN